MNGGKTMKTKFKWLKSLIVGIMILTLFMVTFPLNAFASELIDTKLAKRNYPIQLIQEMTTEEKENLISDDCYFESSKTYSLDENCNLLNVNNDKDIATIGIIKDEHLRITLTTSKNRDDCTVVSFHYYWKQLPVNRLQDPICLGWDSSIFRYKTNSFRSEDQYRKIYNGPVYTHSKNTKAADVKSNYISWFADLKGYTATPVELFGYAMITLQPQKRQKSTQLYLQYVHSKLSAVPSISFQNGNFTVGAGKSYDYWSDAFDVTS